MKIDAGMKYRAGVELQNILNNRPEELHVWNMLAEMYFEAGFHDAAGKYWLFYPSNELRVVRSVDVYRASMNNSASRILKNLKFRGDKSKLPKFSREILEELELDCLANKEHTPEYKRIQHGYENKGPEPNNSGAGCILVFIAIVIALITIFTAGFATTTINCFF